MIGLKKMKKAELAELCVKYGVDAEGTKALLIENLKDAIRAEDVVSSGEKVDGIV